MYLVKDLEKKARLIEGRQVHCMQQRDLGFSEISLLN